MFAGVGGICLGFTSTSTDEKGFEVAWANEIDSDACLTYRENFSHPLFEGDINEILMNPNFREVKDAMFSKPIDVLTGGFPCQPFSVAGNRLGFADERGNLFWSIVNVIKELDARHEKPRVLLLENVKNLKSHDGGNTYAVIKSELEDLGYTIKDAVLNTNKFTDLPQNRERIFIIGFLNEEDVNAFTLFDDLDEHLVEKSLAKRKSDIEAIIDLDLPYEGNEIYFYTRDKFPHYFQTEAEYLAIPPQERKEVLINLTDSVDEKHQFYQIRRGMYIRKNTTNTCPTLTANMGIGGHNVPLILTDAGIRKLTPAEVFKLQGFPLGNGYELPLKKGKRAYPRTSLYKQAGNAVSVPVIQLLAREILEVLD